MPKVASLLPRRRFETVGSEVPEGWEFEFLTSQGEDDIIAACRNADFLLLPSTYPRVSSRIIENIPSVCLIQMGGSGYDQVDIDAAAGLNLPVANTRGENALAVAEFAIGLLIALQRRVLMADREIKAGRYGKVREILLTGGVPEVHGTRLGLVGLGAIGRHVARLAGTLGAEVGYHTPGRKSVELERELGVTYQSWEELLSSSDAVSLHVPLNDRTRGLIGRRELGLMRSGALIINTARGEVIDQAALAEALASGHLGGAAIDTLAPEPPSPDHPLLLLPQPALAKLILTPHLAGVTTGSFRRMLRSALQNMQDVAAGGEPANVVNGIGRARRSFQTRQGYS
jgi:D-3-phosphoglycerate dehydrogenase